MLEAFSKTAVAPLGFICTTYQAQSLAIAGSCNLRFGYRDDKASVFANDLWRDLTSCRSGFEASPDLAVNHPDTYLLRVWRTDGATYRLSQKDKAALESTYVFLSFEPM